MQLSTLRRPFEPALRRCFHLYWRFARGLTLGVRAVVVDGQGRVFLIKHSYVSGWHLPGGGVEPGETTRTAIERELKEEGNIDLGQDPAMFAIYFNGRVSKRDHVVLYVVREFSQPTPPKANAEIVAHGFFSLDAMPGDTTAGTRARIAEVLGGVPVSPNW